MAERPTGPFGVDVPWELVPDPASPTGYAEPVADGQVRTLLMELLLVARGLLVASAIEPHIEVHNDGLEDVRAGLLNLADAIAALPQPVASAAFEGLPVEQLEYLSGGLTDAQLRSRPLRVEGPATDAEMRAKPLPVEIIRDNNPMPITGRVGGAVGVTGFPTAFVENNRLRVTFPADESGLTDAELRAAPVPVSGTVTVNEPVTVDGTVALDAASLAALESVTVTDGGGSVTVDGPVTDAQMRAVPVPVSGTVSVSEPVTVDGTVALDAGTLAALESVTVVDGGGSITVDGPLTDAQVRATPLPVSGTVTVNEPVTVDGTVALDAGTLAALESITVVDGGGSITVDGPLTDGQIRATPLPVSGTVTVNEPVTVDGTVALDSATLTALETITVVDGGGSLTVDGTVTATPTKAPTSTYADVGTSTVVATLIASNAARLGGTVYNDSSAVMYVKYGAGASASSFNVALAPLTSGVAGYLEIPGFYTGIVTGILASSTGTARVAELT